VFVIPLTLSRLVHRPKATNNAAKGFKRQGKGQFARDGLEPAAPSSPQPHAAGGVVRRIVLDAPSRRVDPYAPPTGIKITVLNTGK
jgi:hypothetical protein